MCRLIVNAFASLDPNRRTSGAPEEDRTGGESLPHMRAGEASEGCGMSSYPFGPGRAAASSPRAGFGGSVGLPGDDGYDARATWAGGIDQLPEVVAEALHPVDVRRQHRRVRPSASRGVCSENGTSVTLRRSREDDPAG